MNNIITLFHKYKWILLSITFLTLISLANSFPDGFIFSGGDIFQIINKEWIESNGKYLWSNSTGEGGFSSSFVTYPVYFIYFKIVDFLNLKPASQSVLFYLFYLIGSYTTCLLSLSIIYPAEDYKKYLKNIIALLYALNPYTFHLFYFIWGFSLFPTIYILFPLVFTLTFKFYRNKISTLNVLLLYLIFLLCAIPFSNPAFFVSANLIIFFFCILNFGISINFFKKALLYYSIQALALVWCVLPSVAYWLGDSNPINDNEIFNFKEWILWQRLNFLDTLTLDPYSLSGAKNPSMTLFFGSIFILLILFFLIKNIFPKKLFLAVLTTILFIVLIETKGNGLISDDWAVLLFSNPILGALRSYGKAYIYLPFLFLFTIYVALINCKDPKKILFFLVLCNCIAIYPLFTGKMQLNFSSNLPQNQSCYTVENCNLNLIPDDYYQAARAIQKDGLNGKILSAPYSVINSPGWANYPSWKHIGADPTPQLFHIPTIQMNAYGSFGYPYGLNWSRSQSDQSIQLLHLASNLGVNYILFHLDADKQFIQPSLKFMEDMSFNGDLTRIFVSKNLIIYRVASKYRRQLISAEIKSTLTSKWIEREVVYSKINPTKFYVELPYTNQEVKLAFRETFSKYWAIYQPSGGDSALLGQFFNYLAVFTSPSLSNTKQSLFEGYGNLWTFNPMQWCMEVQGGCQIVNKNGAYYIPITLEFKMQPLIYGLITVTALIVVIFSLIFLANHKKRRRPNEPL